MFSMKRQRFVVIDEQTVDELICEAEKEMTGGLEE
jgi:hypothetical protein